VAGGPAPDILIVNDGDLTFARARFDDRSWRNLSDVALDVGDPLSEAVCWAAAWDMTMTAELAAAGYVDLVRRRITAGSLPVGLARLLRKAVTAADLYAPPGQRPVLRHRLAAAVLEAMKAQPPGSRSRAELAAVFAASAEGHEQFGLLRSWLSGAGQRGGTPLSLELHRRILATLSAAGLASDEELDAYAASDPAGGLAHRASCRAMRPDRAAKQAAWTAALAPDQPLYLTAAHASGIWVPGQETLLTSFRDRYFAEVLPTAITRPDRTGLRLGRLLFPATLADSATIAATEATLASGALAGPYHQMLTEQLTDLRRAHRTGWLMQAIRSSSGGRLLPGGITPGQQAWP
jgi:aminopeptidase N